MTMTTGSYQAEQKLECTFGLDDRVDIAPPSFTLLIFKQTITSMHSLNVNTKQVPSSLYISLHCDSKNDTDVAHYN